MLRNAWLIALAVMCGVSACSDNRPPLAEVRGTVTLNGQPLPGKSIQFIPEPNTLGAGAGANTLVDGTYRLLAVRANVTRDTYGVVPGEYKVIINEPTFPIDLPLESPPPNSDEPVAAVGPPAPKRSTIPKRYMTPELTEFQVTVPPEGGTFDFALTSKR